MAKYTIDIDVNLKSVEDLKKELTALEAEFSTLSIGSKGFTELGNKIKGIKSQLKDVELQFEGLDKEQKATALVDTFQGLVGAVGAVSSAFIAFGADSEAIEGAEKKLLGVIGVVGGIRDASNGLVAANKLLGPSFTALGDTIKAGFVAGATGAQTFKAALISTGIGALIVAVGFLVTNFDDLFNSAEKTNKEIQSGLEKEIALTQQLSVYRSNDAKIAEANAKAEGKSIQEVAAIRQTELIRQRDEAIAEVQKINAAADKQLENVAKGSKEETAILTKASELRVKAIAKRQQAETALTLDQINTTDQIEKEAQAKRDKRDADRIATRKDTAAKEIQAEKSKQEALRALDEAQATEGLDAITTKYANELSKLKEAQAEELKQTNLSQEAINDINDKYAALKKTNEINRVAETDKFTKDATQKSLDDAKKKADDLKALQDKINTAEAVSDADKRALQIQNLTTYYDELIAEATKNGLDVTALNQAKIDALAKQNDEFSKTDLEKTKALNAAKLNSQLEFTQQVGNAIGALGGLFQQGSDAAKAAALADIAIGTGVGFIRALTIAQETSEAAGPGAAFAFPIFYASQIAAVLGAASRAKAILNSGKGGGGGSAPSVPTPSLGNYSGPTQGFLGGTPQIPNTNTGGGAGTTGGAQTGGRTTGGAYKTYVLAGDVTSAQAADARINQRRQF